jgi:DNA-binding NtrC family response regulator
MAEPGTVPLSTPGTPLRRLRLKVTEGPDAGAEITTEGDAACIGTAAGNDLRLSDPAVSRFHVELRRRGARVEVHDLHSTNGTHIAGVSLEGQSAAVQPGTVLLVGETRLRIDDGDVVMVQRGPGHVGDLQTRAPAMRRLLERLVQVAPTDVSVLITGESGTGKERVARALHDGSPRARSPFITVDCGAVPAPLFTNELFGHERGAFTGADSQRRGAFERAGDGTLFFDEVGELAPELQTALLGILSRHRFQRIGGEKTLEARARIVAATNRDLRADVNRGTFRLDLYYRLAEAELEVPPLRERREDLPLIVEQILREEGSEAPLEDVMDAETLASFKRHPWPGNIRELRSALRRQLHLGGTLPHAPPRSGRRFDLGELTTLPYREARRTLTDEFERTYLQALLDRTDGNVRAAAREARMDRSYLVDLLKRHDLPTGG